MKPLGKAIRTAHLEKRPWQQELPKFLLNYRTTPHSTTKVPPAELLYNREIRGKLPALPCNAKVTKRHREAKDNQEKEKRKGKMYADKHRHTQPSKIKVGDTVLVKQKKQNKFSTIFAATPYTVVSVKGSKVVAENDNHRTTRNVTFIKTIPSRIGTDEDDDQLIMEPRQTNTRQEVGQPIQPRRLNRNRMQTELYGYPVTS